MAALPGAERADRCDQRGDLPSQTRGSRPGGCDPRVIGGKGGLCDRSRLDLEAGVRAEATAEVTRLTCLLAPLARFIHAFDGSLHMLEVAAAKLRASGFENWRVAVGDHRRISAPDGQADVAIAGWSVCYVVGEAATWRAELDTVLAEMRRVLRPGGMIILLETLGTGCEQPDPPSKLVPYYDDLEAGGFQRCWIRTDYRFADRDEAESLTRFFFGEAMVKKIQTRGEDVLLPECTGIWWKKPPIQTA